MMSEFFAFLKQYGVIGLAIAVIIGGKANALVTTPRRMAHCNA